MTFLLRIVLIAVLMTGSLFAVDPVNTGYFSNIAIKGYDPVAYFELHTPTKGLKEFSYTYNGAEWRFASQEHLDLFKENPEAYAPQYGGYCAWAVSQNKTAPVDPKQWAIHEGKLYLNYNAKIQKRWQKDVPGFIELANKHWPGLVDQG